MRTARAVPTGLARVRSGVGVDAHRARGADAVAVQEHHDLAHRRLLGPGGGDPLLPHRPDAADLPQPFGVRLDDVEHPLAEGADELLRVDRPDPPDHAGAQVPLDALGGGGRGGLQEPGSELRAVGAVVLPLAGGGDPFPGGHRGGVADDGHQLPVPARLDPQDAEPAVLAVEGHALDGTGEDFTLG